MERILLRPVEVADALGIGVVPGVRAHWVRGASVDSHRCERTVPLAALQAWIAKQAEVGSEVRA